MTDGINQSRTGSFRAVVRAGADETVYQRAGAGRPIVALSTRTLDDGAWSAVITGLATRFRVIVPLVDPGRADFSGWLRRFLDGIGLTSAVLLADEPLSAPALGFSVLDTDRVEGLVVFAESDADSVTEIGNCRVLTVRPGRPVEELVGVVGLFLTGESIDLE